MHPPLPQGSNHPPHPMLELWCSRQEYSFIIPARRCAGVSVGALGVQGIGRHAFVRGWGLSTECDFPPEDVSNLSPLLPLTPLRRIEDLA